MLVLCAASACVSPVDSAEETSALTASATTVFSLTFDDTLADQYQVADLVEARGMRAVFYINDSRLDTAGFLTRAQAIDLQTRGHEIGGHTVGHVRLPTVSLDEARTQICNDRASLLDGGFAATTFAYPFGDDNAAVQRIAADCGYNASRDVGGLVSPTCPSCPWANPMKPVNPQAIRTYDSVETDTTLAEMQQQVLDAEQHGGGYVPMVFHHVCDACASNAVTAAQLAAFLDWLAARTPTTQVATTQEVVGGAIQPQVRYPDPANLARNPSVENDADANQIPDCWQRGGFGTNTTTYALTSDTSDGSTAQQLTVTAFTSGGRRLVTAQDTGACAPLVTPGKHYSISAFYKATTPPRVTVYYRTTAGAWSWFAETPLLPTSTTYREATLTTPAMPADATALSFGLGIFGVGSLTLDQHRLIEGLPPPAIDKLVPLFAIACNGDTCSTAPYAAAVRISLAASDPSGIAQLRYTTDGSDPTTGTLYSGAFTVDAAATVRAIAVDNAGNRTFRSAKLGFGPPPDTTPPALALACNGAACTGSYAAPASVSLTATDVGGVQEVRYTTDNSDPVVGITYTGPFTVSTTSTVRATAVDVAGNRSSLSQAIAIGGPTNLLQNASLELDANSDQVPDCWKRGRYGTNTAVWTIVADAFDGARAQRLDITSYTSGGGRLVSAQDACAPAATPGRRYTMTGYYKATVTPRVTAYYRSASGVWTYLAESTALPVSGTYVQATFTTPVIPVGATAISVGLSIFAVGSLTTDLYTLAEAP